MSFDEDVGPAEGRRTSDLGHRTSDLSKDVGHRTYQKTLDPFTSPDSILQCAFPLRLSASRLRGFCERTDQYVLGLP
jgi:hypothetical protein